MWVNTWGINLTNKSLNKSSIWCRKPDLVILYINAQIIHDFNSNKNSSLGGIFFLDEVISQDLWNMLIDCDDSL